MYSTSSIIDGSMSREACPTMCFFIKVLVASLLGCQVCYCGQADCGTNSFLSPSPTCPGDQLVLNCSSFDDSGDPPVGTTSWIVNSSHSAPECILSHAQWPMSSAECGSFQAQAFEKSPEDCFISTLSTTASLSLDGVEVVCFVSHGVPDMEVGRATINITGPVETTGVSCGAIRDGSSANTQNLTISWTTEEEFPDQTSGYVVSVLPLEQTGAERVYNIAPGSSEFMNKQLEVEVGVGTEYQITVRADNCGDRQEGNNVSIRGFNVPRPPQVGVRRVDRMKSKGVVRAVLHALDIKIAIMDPTASCAAGPIDAFMISFDPPEVGSPVTLRRNDDTYCSDTALQCTYTHVLPRNLSVSHIVVHVHATASNIAGQSLLSSFTLKLDTINITVSSFVPPLQATITVMDEFSDLVNCSFMFGTDNTYMNLPKNGNLSMNSTGSEIVFDLGNLEDSIYYYNLSCVMNSNISSIIQGMFQTICSEEDLSSVGDSAECSAPVGYSCLLVDEKAEADVIFNETTAEYRGNSSNHCLQGNVTRRCMFDNNGRWDGDTPSFLGVATDQKLEAWHMAVIAIEIVFFLIGISVCSVLGTMLVLRASTKTEGVFGALMLVVSVITFPVSLITWCVMKKRKWDKNKVKLRPLYKLFIVASMVIMVIVVITWIVLIAYVASNEVYDNGYLRGEDGVCVATDSDSQKVRRTVLVIVCLLPSLLVTLEWCAMVAMWRWGTAAIDGSDSGTSSNQTELQNSTCTESPNGLPQQGERDTSMNASESTNSTHSQTQTNRAEE